MSGGHFEHRDYILEEFANQIDCDLKHNDTPEGFDTDETYGYSSVGFSLSQETAVYMTKVSKQLRQLKETLRLDDYVVSCDTSENEFLKYIKENPLPTE